MACATLKRSLDWESLNQRPTKRRRCNPFTTASATPQNSNAQATSAKVTEPTQSAFADATLTKLTPGKTAVDFPFACIFDFFSSTFPLPSQIK